MKLYSLILTFFVFISLTLSAAPADVHVLKFMCPPSDTLVIDGPLEISGVIVGDCLSANMELNPNVTYSKVDLTLNDRTTYVQTLDGSAGARLVFEETAFNILHFGDRVVLNLDGCLLEHATEPDRITVRHLGPLSVKSVTPGGEVFLKEKAIKDLTDDDIYTYVTLRGMEMVFKDGCYTDIYEPYGQYVESIHHDYYDVNRRMDGWASLLRDQEGRTIYMLVNTLCPWRRTGKPLVRGFGPVSGIIVHTLMRRYGGDMGRYSIRPIDEKGLGFSKKNKPVWKTLAGWCLDGSNGQALEFEMLGVQTGVWKNGRKGDRLVSDIGKARAFFWTDSDSYIHIDSDVNALDAQGKGYAINGAIFFKGPSWKWFDFAPDGSAEGKSFFVEVDARKVKGEEMTLNFAWYAGTQDGNDNWGYPAEWKVMYSLDGGPWKLVRETATGAKSFFLRSLPWWDKQILIGNGSTPYIKTSFDSGLGSQQRSFSIPSEAFGHEVLFRITPSSTLRSLLRSNPADNCVMETNRIKNHDDGLRTLIRFGDIFIDYR